MPHCLQLRAASGMLSQPRRFAEGTSWQVPRLPPLTLCRRQLAVVTAILLGDPSVIAMISVMASPALDASLDRPLPYLQVALAAAGPGRQGRQRWGHQGCPA